MRSTIEILSDVKDNIDVDKEELKLALLVLDSINFFNHNHIRRLLAGGIGAELTVTEFPGSCKDLGISKYEYDAMKMDPFEYLGEDKIPGTESWKYFHDIHTNILNAVMKFEQQEVEV